MTEAAMDMGATGAGDRAVAAEQARLHLEALGSEVVTRVTHKGLYRMTVAQALPFLRLSGGVTDEEGRAARIESVSVSMEGDTPNLILELVYDDEEPVRVWIPPSELGVGRPRKERRDPTVPYEFQRAREETRPYAFDSVLPEDEDEIEVDVEVVLDEGLDGGLMKTPPPTAGLFSRLWMGLARAAVVLASWLML